MLQCGQRKINHQLRHEAARGCCTFLAFLAVQLPPAWATPAEHASRVDGTKRRQCQQQAVESEIGRASAWSGDVGTGSPAKVLYY
jgi:hypothetical protein